MNNDGCAALFKSISDEKRFRIIEMLSSGSLCACRILEQFEFTQPALSQHMKVLVGCGLVNGVRAGNWMHYSLNRDKIFEMIGILEHMVKSTNAENVEKRCESAKE